VLHETFLVTIGTNQYNFKKSLLQVNIRVEVSEKWHHGVARRAPVRREEETNVFGAFKELSCNFFGGSASFTLAFRGSLLGQEFVSNQFVQLGASNINWWLEERVDVKVLINIENWLHIVWVHITISLLLFFCHFMLI
jgi:hypothetical protein